MKAKELRIGNLVSFNHHEFKIYFIGPEYPLLDTIEFGIGVVEWNDLSPIPLTEEWLLKLGIKNIGCDDDGDRIWTDGKEPWFLQIEGDFYLQEYGRKIQYVHQLQNLYFALTGEELTIKTDKQ